MGTGVLCSMLHEMIRTAGLRSTSEAYPHKVSKGTLTHRIALVCLWWSRERCGTTPRDVVVMKPGVEIWILVPAVNGKASGRLRIRLPMRGPYLFGVDKVKLKDAQAPGLVMENVSVRKKC